MLSWRMNSSSSAQGTAGQRPRLARHRRMAEPVALVPVPGHPGPGVLGYGCRRPGGPAGTGAAGRRSRPVVPAPVRGQHEHRDVAGAAGPPARPRGCCRRGRRSAMTTAVSGAVGGGHGVQHGEQLDCARTPGSARTSGSGGHGGRGRGGQVFAAQVRGPLGRAAARCRQRERGEQPAVGPAPAMGPPCGLAAAACAARHSSLPFPGPAGQFAQDGQGQRCCHRTAAGAALRCRKTRSTRARAVASAALSASSNHRLGGADVPPRQ